MLGYEYRHRARRCGYRTPGGDVISAFLLALCLLYPICRRALHAQMPDVEALEDYWLSGSTLFIGGSGMLFVGLQFTTAINGALITRRNR